MWARAALLAVVAVGLAACTSGGSSGPLDSSPPFPSSSTVSPSELAIHVIKPYFLNTHCGIHEAKVGDDFYAASPELSDGNGNPPDGWDNPTQTGTMTQYSDGTAQFWSIDGDLDASFILRPDAKDFLQTCR